MKLQTLLRGIAVTASDAAMDTEITGVSYDSRTTKPGDLFVAVSGRHPRRARRWHSLAATGTATRRT